MRRRRRPRPLGDPEQGAPLPGGWHRRQRSDGRGIRSASRRRAAGPARRRAATAGTFAGGRPACLLPNTGRSSVLGASGRTISYRCTCPSACTWWRGTTGRCGSPSSPGCTQGKWPKPVKFSTWRAASQRHRYGPAATTAQSPVSSSGTPGSGHRGSSSAIQTSPYRSCTRNRHAPAISAVPPAVVGTPVRRPRSSPATARCRGTRADRRSPAARRWPRARPPAAHRAGRRVPGGQRRH